MNKITNAELKKLAKEQYKSVSIIKEISDCINRKIVEKALLEMFEIGYRYGETSNNK